MNCIRDYGKGSNRTALPHRAVNSLTQKAVMSCHINYHNVRQKPTEAAAWSFKQHKGVMTETGRICPQNETLLTRSRNHNKQHW